MALRIQNSGQKQAIRWPDWPVELAWSAASVYSAVPVMFQICQLLPWICLSAYRNLDRMRFLYSSSFGCSGSLWCIGAAYARPVERGGLVDSLLHHFCDVSPNFHRPCDVIKTNINVFSRQICFYGLDHLRQATGIQFSSFYAIVCFMLQASQLFKEISSPMHAFIQLLKVIKSRAVQSMQFKA